MRTFWNQGVFPWKAAKVFPTETLTEGEHDGLGEVRENRQDCDGGCVGVKCKSL